MDSINEHTTLFAHEPVKIKRCIVRGFSGKGHEKGFLALAGE